MVKTAKVKTTTTASSVLRRIRRVRRSSLTKPVCQCERVLSSSIVECSNFHLVSCKCKQYYLHAECAAFYCSSLHSCGVCRTNFVRSQPNNKTLFETVLDQRRKSMHVKS